LERLSTKIAEWSAASPELVVERWRRLSSTLGRRVRVEAGGRVTEGVAQDLGPRGELIVDGEPVVAGSVTHL
jgi:biotin-(acetyl-CoA carboxylase) ligase